MMLDDEARRAGATEPLRSDEVAPGKGRNLRCVRCGHSLANSKDRIEVDGKSEHVFVNPSAMEFRIVCLRDAPGCSAWGAAETFWSWFRGYAWRATLCHQCSAHVGWSFERAGDHFWGLIVDRLAEDD